MADYAGFWFAGSSCNVIQLLPLKLMIGVLIASFAFLELSGITKQLFVYLPVLTSSKAAEKAPLLLCAAAILLFAVATALAASVI